MLIVDGLIKRYGEVAALDGFSLRIAPGEVLGLIGHNGAGKTTFAEVVTGLTRPDAGRVEVAGVDIRRDPRAARALIGYAPQELGLYPTATVRDNLRVFGRLHGLRGRGLTTAIGQVAADLTLTEVLDKTVGVLSGGQRRRTQAATALLHRPALLLLDEPTAGADPATREALLAVVAARAAAGAAVCYTTHYLPELDRLDATIAVAQRGRVIARGTRSTLLRGLPGHAVVSYADGTQRAISAADPVPELIGVLQSGPAPTTISLHEPDLDDLYHCLATTEDRS